MSCRLCRRRVDAPGYFFFPFFSVLAACSFLASPAFAFSSDFPIFPFVAASVALFISAIFALSLASSALSSLMVLCCAAAFCYSAAKLSLQVVSAASLSLFSHAEPVSSAPRQRATIAFNILAMRSPRWLLNGLSSSLATVAARSNRCAMTTASSAAELPP